MTHFTPVSALTGGLLIGVSVALLWIATGKVAGISGVLGEALVPPRPGQFWRLVFLSGLAVGGLGWAWWQPGRFAWSAPSHPWLLASAGVLVGFGTRLGSGCTSGHGLFGLSRLSGRSAVATAVFMGTGMAAVYLATHALGVKL